MSKSVVQFLRGLDLSGSDIGFQKTREENLSSQNNAEKFVWSREMTRLQWLKLRDTGIEAFDPQLADIDSLEHLTLSKNNLEAISSDFAKLSLLRVLNLRMNNILSSCIDEDLFKLRYLQVIDLSFNQLTTIPRSLGNVTSLLVLNLSHNKLTNIPSDIFINCTDLMFLDISYNNIESLPTQLRRLTNLETLALNNNPLRQAQLRSLSALKQLTSLQLSATERKLDTFPQDLDKLSILVELDLSDNALPRLPQCVYQLRSLRKLNLCNNELTDLAGLVDCWPNIEYLNLSYNKLASLPSAICRLSMLRKLYLNDNCLTFSGIPSGIGKLQDLEVFNASDNKLENIPESLCRCGRLKKLLLNSNELVTLPDAIHYLIETLDYFEVEDNPDLVFPQKPPELKKGAGAAFYNIDFSLETQLRLAKGKPLESATQAKPKDVGGRLRRLKKLRCDEGAGSSRVLEGMQRVAKEKENLMHAAEEEEKQVAAKRWQDALSRPNLDYSKIFDPDVGIVPGLNIWEIDEFYPKLIEEDCLHGKFYDGDCYIILDTRIDDMSSLVWNIFYWIGSHSTLDKKACAAMHAVNLRNFLSAECRTQREEEGDESDSFKALFSTLGGITVLSGAQAESGFMRAEERIPRPKLYRLYGERTVSMVSMRVSPESLDPKYVYLLDIHTQLYLWLGTKSRLMLQSKGRLIAEKINNRERKGKAEIFIQLERRESQEFWSIICHGEDSNESEDYSGSECSSRRHSVEPSNKHQEEPISTIFKYTAIDHIPLDWAPSHPIVFDIKLGRGYLEMPQIELKDGKLYRDILEPKKVLIIKCGGEIFMWIGEKSARFLRSAGWRLAQELVARLPCDRFIQPIACTQGSETQVFKTQFQDWEEILAVDFTRTAESIGRRGANINNILTNDQIKVDLRAFFVPREEQMPWSEAVETIQEWNEELMGGEAENDNMPPGKVKYRLKQFFNMGKKWTPVEKRWIGHFFSKDSYLVIANYYVYPEDEEDEESPEDEEDITKAIIYFWQGRLASQMDYLTFNFSLRKNMEERLAEVANSTGIGINKRSVELKHMFQQKEDLLFQAHFESRMVIHEGHYKERYSEERMNKVEMFHLRTNSNAITTRCIEVTPNAQLLNSCFCYIVKIPGRMLSDSSKPGIVYVWIGDKAETEEIDIIDDIARELYEEDGLEICRICEGEEDELFWTALGGRKVYETEAEYLKHSRLFRLSNEQGYFNVSEKCSDFCQDDLADEDVMLLDNGQQIYLWVGKRTSDVEVKLSLQSAKLYKDHLEKIRQSKPRQLKLTTKNCEPINFRKCFHAWGPFKEVKDWSG